MADKLTKLSQAIRLGSTFRPEHREHFLNIHCGSCAMGAAYEATFGIDSATFDSEGILQVMASSEMSSRYEVPGRLCQKLSLLHKDGGATRLEIARYLEAKGY